MKILISGVNSRLAHKVVDELESPDHEIYGTIRNASKTHSKFVKKTFILDLSTDNEFYFLEGLKPNVFIHIASMPTISDFSTSTDESKSAHTYFSSTYKLFSKITSNMSQNGGGIILIAGSIAGQAGSYFPSVAPYCIYKSYLEAISAGINSESKNTKIRSTYVVFGNLRNPEATRDPKGSYVSYLTAAKELSRLATLPEDAFIPKLYLSPSI